METKTLTKRNAERFMEHINPFVRFDGGKIAAIRDAKGYTLREFTDLINMSLPKDLQFTYETLRNWESGQGEPKFSQWLRIRIALAIKSDLEVCRKDSVS